MARYLKTVGVPIMLHVLVNFANEDDEEVVASTRQMIVDILEENWQDTFEYDGQEMEFEAVDWIPGEYVHTIEVDEEDDDETQEATEDGTSEASGGVRSPVGDVQAARERDEGLPM